MNDPLLSDVLSRLQAAVPAQPAPLFPHPRSGLAAKLLPTSNEPDARFIILRNFLRSVLPENGPIYFGVTIPAKQCREAPRHYACQTIDDLAARLISLEDGGHEVYFATASYGQARYTDANGKSRQRCGDNVTYVRACWLDIDVGAEKAAQGSGYSTLEEAQQALTDFSSQLGIKPSHVISSGRGLHVYFAFKESVSAPEWKSVAKLLKHACALGGLLADGARTEDIASVLRPIGATHRKDPASPQKVRPLSIEEPVAFHSFRDALGELSAGLRRSRGASLAVTNGATLTLTARPGWHGRKVVDNNDLISTPHSLPWVHGLASQDQLRILDEACSAIPEAEWSRYETWQTIIASFRALRGLNDAALLEILCRHSARSPKWTEDGWDLDRLREKFQSFRGGSPRRVFELAEAYGWSRTTNSALQPFEDEKAAEEYLVDRFIFVMDQAGYLDTKSRQLISPAALDESQSWLTRRIGTSPRKLLKGSALTRRADSLGYNPGADATYEDGSKVLANLYTPWDPPDLAPTLKEQQLWDWFIEDHLFRRAEDKDARDYFLNALAYPLQNPGRRVASVPLLIGEQFGSGKSTLMERVPRLVYGCRNVTVAAQSEVESGFNDWHANAQIVCFPEIWMGGNNAKKVANELKDKITNDVLRVYPKGLKGYSQPNRATLFATSNYEDAVHLREGDRRWGVHITDAPKMTPVQAKALHTFLDSDRAPGVLRYILRRRNLANFNPAGDPPMTEGKCRVIAASRSVIEAEIVEMFQNGDAPFDRELLALEWIRAALRDRIPGSENIAPRKLAEYVQAKPISATRLSGRRRIKAQRTLGHSGLSVWLDGKHTVWCTQNAQIWKDVADKDIAKHLENGSPPSLLSSALADQATKEMQDFERPKSMTEATQGPVSGGNGGAS